MNKIFKRIKRIKNDKLLTLCLFIALALVMYGSLYSNIQPERLDLRLFSIAKTDIISPITIEDVEATTQKKQEAAQEVKDQYVLKTDYAENRVEIISALFDAVIDVDKQEINNEVDNSGNAMDNIEQPIHTQPRPITIDDQLKQLTEMIPLELSESLHRETLIAFLNASPQQLDSARSTTITAIKQIMRLPIMVGEEEDKKQQVASEIQNVNLPIELRNAMTKVAQYAIIPNYVYDMQATEEKRQLAMDQITPVKIRAGQVLAKEGQLIDREIYKQLELVGLLEEDVNSFIYIGLAIFVIVLTSIILNYFYEIKEKTKDQTTYLLIYVLIFSLTILLMKAISLFQIVSEIGYIFPIAMASMLIKMLLNEKMALVSSIIFAICGSLIFNVEMLGKFNFSIGVYFLLSGIAGAIFLNNQNQRLTILRAGLFVSGLNIIVTAAIFMMKNGQYTSLEIGTYLTLALLSGFISAVLTLGLMPVFETGFGILSTMKLIELSSPNHPLLRKILIEAPGTYHHSVMVANLAEAACEAVGANGLLARVGSYYHDIGKTKRPHFFIENQMNIENPHNNIAPQLSKTIITAHPYDGAEMLREYKIPKEIVDIAEQHHGTTLIKYFYFKAKEQGGNNVLESDFRYPGPKAQTKESAIVGIADSVEAAVRSMSNPTPLKIENLVKSILADRLQDGQFDECDITLRELDLAAKSMCETLNGIFHSRIEYPEITNKKVKEA
ncbi:HD family phosphohydrolase [Bacillus sp. Marseille-P3661]|uniref:HD family phosphohydrolase n=1 Tax=Bacillus sp. Marseille-P3661 TaxID=1936234 RepID=UPI000C83E1F0|nr:HD family phosphohydrolase [Bacillus sp. Marseille-P3661]